MMGSSCCKSPYNPRLPNFGKLSFLIDCPLKICSDTEIVKEELHVKTRKYSCSDIIGPLPLGTVMYQPKRPPRKKRRRISRCHSLNYIHKNSVPNLIRSKSATELCTTNFEIFNNHIEEPLVHLSRLIVPISENTILTPKQIEPNNKLKNNTIVAPTIIITEPVVHHENLQEHHQFKPQELISQNKRSFLATLLEDNNNSIYSSEINDLTINTSRKSSITESLREFESSLYEMLTDNLDDEHGSEQSVNLRQILAN